LTSDAAYAIAYQLRRLQHVYAEAIDSRDATALRAAFHPDAELRVFAPGAVEPSSAAQGHDSIGLIVDAMAARYDRTLHVV
jgi:hypothetical protein